MIVPATPPFLAELQHRHKRLPVIPKYRYETQPQHDVGSGKNSEWLNTMASIYLPYFNSQCTHRFVSDQRNRAALIAKLLLPHHKVVRLMDGYGRFTMLLMQAIIEEHGRTRLDKLRFEIVEIEPNAQDYHIKFFRQATSVKCIHRDITKMPMDESTLLYLNFCGIGAAFESVLEFVKGLTTRQLSESLVISYSKARRARICKYKRRFTNAVRERGKFQKLTTRKDFYTIKFEPNEEFRLREAFNRVKPNQRLLASQYDCSQASISNWFTGRVSKKGVGYRAVLAWYNAGCPSL